MTEPIIELKNIKTIVNKGKSTQATILKGINLKVNQGDFITIVGTNGAGKSTLFNVLGGLLPADEGQVFHNGKEITSMPAVDRTKFLSRVFQDPKLGTAPRMTVAENMLLATMRGEHRTLRPRRLKQNLPRFKKLAAVMHNDLENRLNTPTGDLSGGQRQALSFIMATLKRPDVLLLDEHTAALDPHTSLNLMHATNDRIHADHLTALMITHHVEDALKYGNRLLVMKDGQIVADIKEQQKAALSEDDLLKYYE